MCTESEIFLLLYTHRDKALPPCTAMIPTWIVAKGDLDFRCPDYPAGILPTPSRMSLEEPQASVLKMATNTIVATHPYQAARSGLSFRSVARLKTVTTPASAYHSSPTLRLWFFGETLRRSASMPFFLLPRMARWLPCSWSKGSDALRQLKRPSPSRQPPTKSSAGQSRFKRWALALNAS